MRFSLPFGSFHIEPMPSQTQIGLCHGLFVDEAHRGKGHGHELKAYQNHCLIQENFDYAICTVAGTNAAQKKVLGAAGWVRLASFHNRRSNETTEIWGRAVQEQEKV